MEAPSLKKLFRYIIPATIGQAVFFLFTIIDGIFVGNGVGETALGAVNIVLPFVLILNAVNMLIAIGGATVAAVAKGSNDHKRMNLSFLHAVTFATALMIVLSLVCVVFRKQIGYLLGANETYIDYVTDYLFYYSLFLLPGTLSMVMQFFCRVDGAPVLVMTATVVSSLLNIFLDWLFVFPLQMGVGGAAIATGISQTVSLLILLGHLFFRKGILRFSKFEFQFSILGELLSCGVPEAIAQLVTPIATLCMNIAFLDLIGELAVNAFSIISYVSAFCLSVILGVSEGVQPLLGQAHGQQNKKALGFYFRASAITTVAGSAVVYGLLVLFSGPICRLFGADNVTTEYTISVMPVNAWAFIVMSLNVLISTYLYSTLHTKKAMLVNGLRGLVISPLVIFTLPYLFGGYVTWFTFGIYELISLIISLIVFYKTK
ncbi:MAG: MATE family efflux transporter [Oscillospiraceae bacterium]|nr:MATE family efflux transporter [Oscillospiraceae bacterium]